MKAIVLLSSGLDSTVNLLLAKKKFAQVMAVTFDYGQRAAKKEIEAAAKICLKHQIEHEVVDLHWLGEISSSSLNKGNIPVGKHVDISSMETSAKTAKSVWVPNRNGVFLSLAAAFAEARGATYIVPGFNKEEAQTFPDNSKSYLEVLNHSLKFSTQHPQVQATCFTVDMMKDEIVKLGVELEAPFELMWPCYFDGDELCGECESCQRFRQARGF